MQRYFWLIGGSTVVVLFDLITKALAAANLVAPVELLPFLQLELTQNSGIAFGLPIPTLVTIPLSLLVIGVLGWIYLKEIQTNSKLAILAFVLLIGGATSNLIDRVMTGTVTDFIALWSIPNFNLADSAITLSVILLVIFYKRIFITSP